MKWLIAWLLSKLFPYKQPKPGRVNLMRNMEDCR